MWRVPSRVYRSHGFTKVKRMVVGSQLQDKIHERKGGADVHGVSGSYPVVSKAMQLAVCADPWCSRRDICTAMMSTARRVQSAMLLITSSSCDHHTRIYGCVLMATTIYAMVEKDNSFDTQRMLAHGIQAAQTTRYNKPIQQRDALAFTSPYRGHTPTTHATYEFAQFSTNERSHY